MSSVSRGFIPVLLRRDVQTRATTAWKTVSLSRFKKNYTRFLITSATEIEKVGRCTTRAAASVYQGEAIRIIIIFERNDSPGANNPHARPFRTKQSFESHAASRVADKLRFWVFARNDYRESFTAPIHIRIIVNGFARPAGERCRLINLNAHTYPKRIRSYLRYCPPLRRRDTVTDAQRPQMSRGGGLESQIFYPLIRVVYGFFFFFASNT